MTKKQLEAISKRIALHVSECRKQKDFEGMVDMLILMAQSSKELAKLVPELQREILSLRESVSSLEGQLRAINGSRTPKAMKILKAQLELRANALIRIREIVDEVEWG